MVSLGCPGQMLKQKAVVKVKLNKPLAVGEWAFGGKYINWKYPWNRLSVAWDLTSKWGSEVKLQALTLRRSSCCYGNWELWDCGIQVSQQNIIYRHCSGDKEANARSVDQSQCGVQSKELQATKIQPLCCWRNPDGTGCQSPCGGNLHFQKSGSFPNYIAPTAHLLKLRQNVYSALKVWCLTDASSRYWVLFYCYCCWFCLTIQLLI